MAVERDIWIGQLALKHGMISGAQFVEVLELQTSQHSDKSLSDILLSKGYLTEIDILYLQKLKDKPKKEKSNKRLFGKIALEKGILSQEDLDEALGIQEKEFRLGNNRLLGEILITEFDFPLSQVLEILEEQDRQILKCMGCGAQYNIENYQSEKIFFCFTCNDMLTIPDQIHSVRVRMDSPKSAEISNYTVLHKIGTGEMGIVYKGKDRRDGSIIALKVLPRRLLKDKVAVQRFQQEAQTLIKLNHPHIVKGLDFFVSQDLCYYVMEYLEGATVEEVLEEKGAFPEEEAFHVAHSIGKALECAHELSLIHRDIKPANIFLDSSGVAKLFDLGLMKNPLSALHLTGPGAVVGTPVYMSPEQALGKKDIDIRSDFYSLGMTLVHMLTGQRPYQDKSITEIYSRFFKDKFFDFSFLAEIVSPQGFHLLEKMLAGDREERFEEPQELLSAVEKYLKNTSSGPRH